MDILINSKFFPFKIILQQVFTQHGVAALLDCSLKMVQQTFLFAYPKDIPSSIFSLLTEWIQIRVHLNSSWVRMKSCLVQASHMVPLSWQSLVNDWASNSIGSNGKQCEVSGPLRKQEALGHSPVTSRVDAAFTQPWEDLFWEWGKGTGMAEGKDGKTQILKVLLSWWINHPWSLPPSGLLVKWAKYFSQLNLGL